MSSFSRRPTLSLRLRASWFAVLVAGGLFASVLPVSAQEVKSVGFDVLSSYQFIPPPVKAKTEDKDQPKGLEQIPDKVKAFDAQRVSIEGFMLPVRVKDGLVSEFLLLRNQNACCYGQMPAITEWIVVKMAGKGVSSMLDIPILVRGTLRVGARYEQGFITGIYALDADTVVEAYDAKSQTRRE